jgi:hypothetical protein
MDDMIPAVSGRISEYGYDPLTQTVFVRFRDGVLWQYRGVPEHLWEEFQLAPSKDRFIRGVLDHFDHGPAW